MPVLPASGCAGVRENDSELLNEITQPFIASLLMFDPMLKKPMINDSMFQK
jgi:hypothetical protein